MIIHLRGTKKKKQKQRNEKETNYIERVINSF